MARPNISELTDAEVLVANTTRVFRPVYKETPPIPASYDGKYVLLAAVAIDVQATEAQMDAFESLIEGIANVHKAFILAGPARIPIDRQPAGTDLVIGVEAKFDIRPEPEAP